MQKLINLLALFSFATSASIVGAGAYVYVNREALREEAKERITEAISTAMGGQLGSVLSGGVAAPLAEDALPVPAPSLPTPSVPGLPSF